MVVPLVVVNHRYASVLDIFHRIEHGDGSHTYSVVTGSVAVPPSPDADAKEQPTFKMTAVVVRKLKQSLDVDARTTKSMVVMTAVAYSSEPLTQGLLRKEDREAIQ